MKEIRELTTTKELQQRRELISKNDLKETAFDYCLGIYEDNELIATGATKDNIIETVAVSRARHGEGLMNTIVSKLYTHLKNKGYFNIFVFSKSINEKIFNSLGFHTIAKTNHWIFLESNKKGFLNWLNSYKYLAQTENTCIVMNADPFTLGHRYLVEQALKALKGDSKLIIFVVEQDSSYFDFKTRFELVGLGLSDLNQERIIILPSSMYIVSIATFPTYFTKDKKETSFACSALDATLFSEKIAPALNITSRFVGTEPNDLTTAIYNKNLKEKVHGLHIVERLCINNQPISASQVRKHLSNCEFKEMEPFLTKENYQYLVSLKLSRLATNSLIDEVMVTPKPGLVDRENNGSHDDMNLNLFKRSANTLSPYFFNLARLSFKLPSENKINKEIRELGKAAEKAMFTATEGINTHKGAIFSFSVFILAIIQLLKEDKEISTLNISTKVARLSSNLESELKKTKPTTKGEKAFIDYKAKGIRGEAATGYVNVQLAYSYLHEQRKTNNLSDSLCYTLIYLISKVDDTNILTRTDKETAAWAKQECATFLKIGKFEDLKKLDQEFIKKNISPGGSADLLALTIFLYKLTSD